MTETARAYYDSPEGDFENAIAPLDDATQRTLRLSAEACSVPSVSVPANLARFEEIQRTHNILAERARVGGLQVIELAADPDAGRPYPLLIVTFQDMNLDDPETEEIVALVGHHDVVQPHPSKGDDHFRPFIETDEHGTWLNGRGTADMTTIVAGEIEWMIDQQAKPGPNPPFVGIYVGCEENGSDRPNSIYDALAYLKDHNVKVGFTIVGERTGEEWMSKPGMGDQYIKPTLDGAGSLAPVGIENRGWRWMRAQGAKSGSGALKELTRIIEEGRREVVRLNSDEIDPDKLKAQANLQTGFVVPFAHIQGDKTPTDFEAHTWVTVEKKSGAAKHSALVDPADPTLIEELANALQTAEEHFGSDCVSLVALQMGEDQNYNTWDGSGRVVIVIDAPLEEVTTWIGMSTLAEGLSNEVTETKPQGTDVEGTTIGLDVRELLDHKDAVQRMIGKVHEAMESLGLEFEAINNRPPWRCPEDNPHYQKFVAAYEATTGQKPATFVKPHGNDGGAVADEYQAENEEAKRRGWAPVIVYGGIGEGPHGLNERHLVNSSTARAQMLNNLAAEYAA